MSDDGRFPVAMLTLSAAGLVTLIGWEGFSDHATIPVPGDPPTYGVGSTVKDDGSPVTLKDRITVVNALRLAIKDVAGKEIILRKCIKVPLYPAEWDLYVTHGYNVGPYKFCGSQFVKKLNALDYVGACHEFLNWKYVHGLDCSLPENRHICGGVWDRRVDSYKKCMAVQP